MGGKEKRASFDNKDPKTDVFTAPVQLVRNVSAEHPRTNHDDIERVAAVAAHFLPGTTHASTQHIVGKRGLLDIHQRIRICSQLRQHGGLLPVMSVTALNPSLLSQARLVVPIRGRIDMMPVYQTLRRILRRRAN